LSESSVSFRIAKKGVDLFASFDSALDYFFFHQRSIL